MNDEIYLNEKVKVIAIFGEGLNSCRPIKFCRANNREVCISEIGLSYPSCKGSKTIHIFDVTDGGTDYRLEFDSENLIWKLVRESDHYE